MIQIQPCDLKHCQLILLKPCNSLPNVLTIKQLNGELKEVFQFFVCTANMNEVPGMNIINKFADSLIFTPVFTHDH